MNKCTYNKTVVSYFSVVTLFLDFFNVWTVDL